MSENASGEAVDSSVRDDIMVLDAFESPGQHIAVFETDELTAHCPFNFGGPDFYTLTIAYEPDGYVIESKSLKQYLEGYRDKELSAEAIGVQIHSDVVDVINPESAYVRLKQSRRGGIEETVVVGNDPRE